MSLVTDERALRGASDVDFLSVWWTDPVRLKVACHPSTPAHVIAVLAFDAGDYGSKVIAHHALKHPALPHSVAVELVASEKSEVRAALAENPALSLELLERLLADEDSLVRNNAAANPGLPVKRLLELTESGDHATRSGVAANRSAAFDVLIRLLNDKFLSNRARNRLVRLSDEAFHAGLTETGLSHFIGLPRDWVLKALCSRGDG